MGHLVYLLQALKLWIRCDACRASNVSFLESNKQDYLENVFNAKKIVVKKHINNVNTCHTTVKITVTKIGANKAWFVKMERHNLKLLPKIYS